MSRSLRWVIVAGCALAISGLAGTAGATTDVSTFQGNEDATVTHYQQLASDGCTVTLLLLIGEVNRAATGSAGGNIAQAIMTANLRIRNSCTHTVLVDASCLALPANVKVQSALNGATTNGTLACADADTGTPLGCSLSATEVLQGVGDIQASNEHVVQQSGDLTFNFLDRVSHRDAQVTSATINGCGASLTEHDASDARLSSVTVLSIGIAHT